MKLPTSARVSALPLSVPGRSVARTQAFGYLMKNPALPTKGASSAVGASSTGSASAIGAAITLGRSVHAASPRAVPFSASRLPIGASRGRAGAGRTSFPRADATGCLDPTRRDDTIVGIRWIVPPEARLMVRWIELRRRWGVMTRNPRQSSGSRRRGRQGGFPAQPFRRHEGTDTNPTTSPARTERVNEPRATYTCSPSRNRCQLRARRLPGRAHSN